MKDSILRHSIKDSQSVSEADYSEYYKCSYSIILKFNKPFE